MLTVSKSYAVLCLVVLFAVAGCVQQAQETGAGDGNHAIGAQDRPAQDQQSSLPPEPETVCGNGIADFGENCSSCQADANCGADENCVDGNCISTLAESPVLPQEPAKQPKLNVPEVNLQVGLAEWYLAEGEGFYVYGLGKHLGEKFRFKVERIGESGYLEYFATFVLLDENSAFVSRVTSTSGEDVEFQDKEWDRIQLNTNLHLKGINIPPG